MESVTTFPVERVTTFTGLRSRGNYRFNLVVAEPNRGAGIGARALRSDGQGSVIEPGDGTAPAPMDSTATTPTAYRHRTGVPRRNFLIGHIGSGGKHQHVIGRVAGTIQSTFTPTCSWRRKSAALRSRQHPGSTQSSSWQRSRMERFQ